MTRSMNGRPLPAGSPEMQALLAYVEFLSTGSRRASDCPGSASAGCPSSTAPPIPCAARPATPMPAPCVTGPTAKASAAACRTTDLGYMVPPLWGNDSFNDGAGMARLITAANFIHFNMPHGVDYTNPQLTPEQSWDIAAYLVSQPRPQKAGLDKDFPDRLEKPVDVPYGPYADGFSEQQHKYGPFAPIRAAIAKLKAEKGASGAAAALTRAGRAGDATQSAPMTLASRCDVEPSRPGRRCLPPTIRPASAAPLRGRVSHSTTGKTPAQRCSCGPRWSARSGSSSPPWSIIGGKSRSTSPRAGSPRRRCRTRDGSFRSTSISSTID